MKLKALIRRVIRYDPNMRPTECYSQDGEDLILSRLLEGQNIGFYVDVGAHHPVRFSNTYLFYKKGWRGINIDAMPGSMKCFDRIRPEDLNIECGVAKTSGKAVFYIFNEPALNTFDPIEAEQKNREPYYLKDTIKVPVERLDVLLDKNLPNGKEIDFLSVDVEGKDEEALKSNNWDRFRPRYVLAETLRADLNSMMRDCSLVNFMRSVGYEPIAKAYNTTIFKIK